MKLSFVLSSLFVLAAAAPAFARDSAHLVCTGFMAAQPDPDNYGLAIIFDENRAPDGENRVETLSAVWSADLYQGTRLNTKGGFGENGVITLKAKSPAKKGAFFKGNYNIVDNTKTGGYQLRLEGSLNLTPATASAAQKISTVLDCVDISN